MRVKDVQSSPRAELMEQSLEYSRCSWFELMEQIVIPSLVVAMCQGEEDVATATMSSDPI